MADKPDWLASVRERQDWTRRGLLTVILRRWWVVVALTLYITVGLLQNIDQFLAARPEHVKSLWNRLFRLPDWSWQTYIAVGCVILLVVTFEVLFRVLKSVSTDAAFLRRRNILIRNRQAVLDRLMHGRNFASAWMSMPTRPEVISWEQDLHTFLTLEVSREVGLKFLSLGGHRHHGSVFPGQTEEAKRKLRAQMEYLEQVSKLVVDLVEEN